MSGIELVDHLLLLAAVLCAMTLVRLLRRSEGIGRGYALVVGGELVLAVTAMSNGNRFLGAVALCLVVATIVVPWLLEHGTRWAFGRGRLVWVARMSSLRASLMPGAGLGRQLPILDGLALLDRDGVDAALAHFRRLADASEDPAELAVIHEQIVSMLFHGQRWDEGIAHYERRFEAGYAAVRPGLALGLLRAYGEAGRLDTAARLLRELEDGPLGLDPNAVELLGQARLTFLAYAGAVAPVDEVIAQRWFVELGISPATAELFLGIAHERAGEPKQARETLRKVEALAGPRDRRVREAARAVLERVGLAGKSGGGESVAGEPGVAPVEEPVEELGPELRGYVELVAIRLRKLIESMPPLRRHERPRATYLLIAVLSLVYGVHALTGGGGIGLLELGGLTVDLWHSGRPSAWARPLTSAWLHADLVSLLFDVYAIWLAGQVVERLLGSLRMALVTIVAALAGTYASVLLLPSLERAGFEGLAVLAPAGGNLMAIGAVTAALWLLTPRQTPSLAPRSRRNLAVTLALLLLANLLMSWPTVVGVSVAPVALLVTFVLASLVVLVLPRELPRGLWVGLATLLTIVLLGNAAAAVLIVSDDPHSYLVDHRSTTCELAGVELRTASEVAPMRLDRDVPFDVPVLDGIVDTLELRDAALVQLAVARGAEPDELALFRLDDQLARELSDTAAGPLPEVFAELFADDPSGSWRAADLWRAGDRVARVIERRLDVPAGQPSATIVLLAAPPEAIEHAPELYAAIMRDAAVGASDRDAAPRCDANH